MTGREYIMNYRQLSRIPNYIRAFGLLNGMKLNISVERLGKNSEELLIFRVPGYHHAISLRDSVADRSIFWQCLVMRQYETRRFPHHKELYHSYMRRIENKRVPTIIDCGGNIGLSAVWFATQFPDSHIIVVEPDTDNLELLKRNVAPFEKRVKPVHGAVWSASSRLSIINPQSGSTAFRVEEDEHGSVQGFSISDLAGSVGCDDPLIVKIDIEGSQKYLFERNTDWVARTDLIIIELDDWLFPWSGTSHAFFKTMALHRFEYLLSGESIFCFNSNLSIP